MPAAATAAMVLTFGILMGCALMGMMLVAGSAAGRVDWERQQSAGERWKTFAEGWELVYRFRHGIHRASGTFEGVAVAVTSNLGAAPDGTSRGGGAEAESESIPADLLVRGRRAFTRHNEPEVLTGAQPFDDAVFLSGHPADVAAIFDKATRNLILSWVRRKAFTLEGGQVHVRAGFAVSDPERMVRPLKGAAYSVRAFELAPAERAGRLARNATEDSVDAVRHSCLEMLIEHHADAPELEPALQAALADPCPSVRLLAAEQLGHSSASDHAREVARLLRGRNEPEELAAALLRLADDGLLEDVVWLRPLTEGLFRDHRVKQAARAAIDGIVARLGGDLGGLAVIDEGAAGRLSAVAIEGALAKVAS